ncbi:MAG TPA: bifunctional glutamate N-acetyltransferase/amino-acid acetyltransferase ArgJ [Actinopolymorphaceae bacterium]
MNSGVTAPTGFTASGVTAGLKPSGKPDLALVVNTGPRFDVAAVFTGNRCKANPVLWSEQAVADGTARAVILNSGGANCFTGPAGFAVTHGTAEHVAGALGIGAGDVVVCSTGLIGEQLDMKLLTTGIDVATAALSATGGNDAAHAIMTTDTVAKQSVTAGSDADGRSFTVGGMAKGAGMLAPALATMLVVLTTDAQVDAAVAKAALTAACSGTLDRLDSDGCMSTNDTVVLMASGAGGSSPDVSTLTTTLTTVLADLGAQLLRDAEGAAHDIAITVEGAASLDDALLVGRAIARNSLVKCAFFGQDPNWGRIIAAVGTTTAAFDPMSLDVAINGVQVCTGSVPDAPRGTVDLSGRDVTVLVGLNSGSAQATIWTNDLTYDYVKENAEYST